MTSMRRRRDSKRLARAPGFPGSALRSPVFVRRCRQNGTYVRDSFRKLSVMNLIFAAFSGRLVTFNAFQMFRATIHILDRRARALPVKQLDFESFCAHTSRWVGLLLVGGSFQPSCFSGSWPRTLLLASGHCLLSNFCLHFQES